MKTLLLCTLMAVFLFFTPNVNFGQAPNLGSTSSFAFFTKAGSFNNDGITVIKGDIGSYAEEVAIPKMAIEDGLVSIPELLTVLGYTRSKGMAKDRINEGAVSFDDEKVFATKVPIEEVHGKVLKLGKKFCRLITP